MTTTTVELAAYPKSILLVDGTAITLRPLAEQDKVQLLNFFRRIPEEDRYYLKENVTSPEVIQGWTTSIDLARVVPILALDGNQVVADATLHRSRSLARGHIGEIRVVVDPAYRNAGLGSKLIRELCDIAAELGLSRVVCELVSHREEPAIVAAGSAGLKEVSVLKDRIRDFWGEYQDLVIMEMALGENQPEMGR